MRLKTEPNLVQPARVAAATPPAPRMKISSRELLGPRGDLIIEHGDRQYRLRLTQNGKLILTA